MEPAGGSDGSDEQVLPTVSGSVSGKGSYQLLDLGPGTAGQKWTVTMQSVPLSAGSFTVVLFDADLDLLMRAVLSPQNSLEHVLRLDTRQVILGVMPSYGSSGGQFGFDVRLADAGSPPAPSPQVVYLNFGAGQSVRVHRRSAISFAPFDAGLLGEMYAGRTAEIKQAIIDTVREDYAPYNVFLLTSDDGAPPTDGPYATIHFGGSDSALLGLADNVDMYNSDPGQTAVVYVESFAIYQVMGLAPDEMGRMIGNVASHELGHLLGLYHTKDPDEVMDSTGSAWDLAGDQTFHRGPLEESVFATGMENSPRLLEQTVGLRSESAVFSSKQLDAAKRLRYKAIRDFVSGELRCRCGNCLNPDE